MLSVIIVHILESICIHRHTTSILCYICQCSDNYGSGIVIIIQEFCKSNWKGSWFFAFVSSQFILILPLKVFQQFMNFFTKAGECFIEHLLIMSTLFINIEVLVYNLPKICGVAWTIKWYNPFFFSLLLARVISWS